MEDRRRRLRTREVTQLDLIVWRSLRSSWREIERSSRHLGHLERADLASSELAHADAAIRRIEAQLGIQK